MSSPNKTPEIYGYYKTVLALYRRYGHLLQMSLAAEFIEGFDGYTLEDLFGARYRETRDVGRVTRENPKSLFAQIGSSESSTGSFDDYFNILAYHLCVMIWNDHKGLRPYYSKSRLYDVMQSVVIRSEGEREGLHWLHAIMQENGLPVNERDE